MTGDYDIIVVGAGHAGCEAAVAAARLGSSVLLITMDMTKIAQMSCNPAMGGIAKGQIVKEIDALGGYSGIVTDASTIQFRMLNRSKGPAMWSPRAQCDKTQFSLNWRYILETTCRLDIWQDSVTSLTFRDSHISGVRVSMGAEFRAKAVIITAGTFLNGKLFIGQQSSTGGRIGEPQKRGHQQQANRNSNRRQQRQRKRREHKAKPREPIERCADDERQHDHTDAFREIRSVEPRDIPAFRGKRPADCRTVHDDQRRKEHNRREEKTSRARPADLREKEIHTRDGVGKRHRHRPRLDLTPKRANRPEDRDDGSAGEDGRKSRVPRHPRRLAELVVVERRREDRQHERRQENQ